MFITAAIKNRAAKKTALKIEAELAAEQKMLDQLRYDNKSDGAFQLHCDRMQLSLIAKRFTAAQSMGLA